VFGLVVVLDRGCILLRQVPCAQHLRASLSVGHAACNKLGYGCRASSILEPLPPFTNLTIHQLQQQQPYVMQQTDSIGIARVDFPRAACQRFRYMCGLNRMVP
jgi:hypothetical protein